MHKRLHNLSEPSRVTSRLSVAAAGGRIFVHPPPPNVYENVARLQDNWATVKRHTEVG